MNKRYGAQKTTKIDETINAVAAYRQNCWRERKWDAFLAAFIVIASLSVTPFQIRLSDNFGACVGILVYLPFLLLVVRMAIQMTRWNRLDRRLYDTFQSDCAEFRQEISPAALASLLDLIRWESEYNLSLKLQSLLKELLQSLRPEDAPILSTDQRSVLHSFLWGDRMEETASLLNRSKAVRGELRPVIVRALAWIGDASSLPVLGDFAEKTEDPGLRKAAFQSIEQIHARIQYGSKEMLRASRSPEASETLLRPLTSSEPYLQTQELLRADHTNSER